MLNRCFSCRNLKLFELTYASVLIRWSILSSSYLFLSVPYSKRIIIAKKMSSSSSSSPLPPPPSKEDDSSSSPKDDETTKNSNDNNDPNDDSQVGKWNLTPFS